MNFNKVGIIIFLILSIFPAYKIYAQTSNAGFVPGSIWYSKDPFEEGDKIKIYTLIFNPDKRELSGTVVFFDKDTLLGKRDFVLPTQTAKDISINWTATVGSHSIFAKIENAKFLISKEEYEKANLAEIETSKSLRTVNKKIILNSNIKSESQPESIENIRKVIEENTPEFIVKPTMRVAIATEGFRSSVGATLENKKKETKNEIQVLNEAKASKIPKENNVFLKPFKYIELFLLTILSFILNNKIAFYIILVILIFLILRYIWHKIF